MARNPTCLADSVEMFVQHQDSTVNVLATVTATATASLTSADIVNTVQTGVVFYLTLSSLTVSTVTAGLNIYGKDAVTGNYFPVSRVSIDGMAASGPYSAIIYPGAATSGAVGGAAPNSANGVIPAVFKVQASLTMTTSTTMSGTYGIQLGMCKIL